MRVSYWERIAAAGFTVPGDRPIERLTQELTSMLGSPDAHLRQDLAITTLSAWISQGVYDDRLHLLGQEFSQSLYLGLGADTNQSVFRRSFNARALGAVMARDASVGQLDRIEVSTWATRLANWYLQEIDLRGYVSGHGWAHALRNGAYALGAFCDHPLCRATEHAGLLDVIAERLHARTAYVFRTEDLDALTSLSLHIVRRDTVAETMFEAWLERLGALTRLRDRDGQASVMARNAEGFLRALHLSIALASEDLPHRGDLLLATLGTLRETQTRRLWTP